MYTDPGYTGKELIHPKYGPVDWMTDEELAYTKALYAGEVSFVDHCVGFLIEALKEAGVYDDTLIVLLSDHGHPHGDHADIMKHDRDLYSELLRIPLLIKSPGGARAGEVSDVLVQQQDLLPTILDTVGVGPVVPMHGKSLWPVVEGKAPELHDYVVMGYHASRHRAVRDKEWSFILRPAGQQDELYNLVNDPKEQNNLIQQHPDVAGRMFARVGRFTRASGRGPQKANIQLEYEIADTPAEE
jgi:arylsulfatase A-like enzyme